MSSGDDQVYDELVDARGAPVMPVDDVWHMLAPLAGHSSDYAVDRTVKALSEESVSTLLEFAQGFAALWISIPPPTHQVMGFEPRESACVWRAAIIAGGPERAEMVAGDEHAWDYGWIGSGTLSLWALPSWAMRRRRDIRGNRHLWVAAQHDFPSAFVPEGVAAMPPPGPPVPRSSRPSVS